MRWPNGLERKRLPLRHRGSFGKLLVLERDREAVERIRSRRPRLLIFDYPKIDVSERKRLDNPSYASVTA